MAVGAEVGITDLKDISLTDWNGDATTASTNACIFSNMPEASFNVTANNSKASFAISNGDDSKSYAYTVKINDNSGKELQTLAHGVASSDLAGSDSKTCNGTDNYQFAVNMAKSDTVQQGDYTDTLTLLVKPV